MKIPVFLKSPIAWMTCWLLLAAAMPGAAKATPPVRTQALRGGGAPVPEDLEARVERLMLASKTNFRGLRVEASEKEDGDGDRQYAVAPGFNACGAGSEKQSVWHWRSQKGNWEYVCAVSFGAAGDADTYFEGFSKRLIGIGRYRWQPERAVDDTTRRRLEAFLDAPKRRLVLDYDVRGDQIRVEFWFKQTENPGPASTPKGDPPEPEGVGAPRPSPQMEKMVGDLIGYSKAGFKAIRVESSLSEDGDGDRNYLAVSRFNVCGAASRYNKVWHWRSMQGNLEYVCDVDFADAEAAGAYFDEFSRRLRTLSAFRWEAEVRSDNTTRRRLVGRRDSPPLKLMLDLDVKGGAAEVEFWFKQKQNPGPSSGADALMRPRADMEAAKRLGQAALGKHLGRDLKRLLSWSKRDYKGLYAPGSVVEDRDGDRKYRIVKRFNLCGSKSEYNFVWHWRSFKGNWEYVCDTNFEQVAVANAYFDALARHLKRQPGYRWEREVAVDDTTRRRLVGWLDSPRRKIQVDLDYEDTNRFQVEFWFKNKDANGEEPNGTGEDDGRVSTGRPGAVERARISPTLQRQIKQLTGWAKTDFEPILDRSTRTEKGGDVNFRVQGFNACGTSSRYNRVWHWTTVRGNWEYVCDVDFSEQAGADAYFDAFRAALRKARGWRVQAEVQVDGTTRRRVEATRQRPPLRMVLDYDVEAEGVTVEFWFKQTFH